VLGGFDTNDQTAKQIEIPLGKRVGLSQGHSMLDEIWVSQNRMTLNRCYTLFTEIWFSFEANCAELTAVRPILSAAKV